MKKLLIIVLLILGGIYGCSPEAEKAADIKKDEIKVERITESEIQNLSGVITNFSPRHMSLMTLKI